MILSDTQSAAVSAPLWRVQPIDEAQTRDLACRLNVPYSVAGVYMRRGLDTPEKVAAFCQPDLNATHSPWLLPDMEAAVARLCLALERGERIHVHGDYDVDGVTATALVVYTLRKLGGDVSFYVPHRVHDGYGLGLKAVERAQANGAKLIVSVDCGTGAQDAAGCARSLGLDLIVTDHHEPEPDVALPDCVAVVNPRRADSLYPFAGLSGAGVAYKTMLALCERRGMTLANVQERLLEWVALGTVVDMARLEGENRTLAQMGMARLAHTQKPGTRALLHACGVPAADLLTSGMIGRLIGPPLNAPGRIDDAHLSLDLLLARDMDEAETLTRSLSALNIRRKALSSQTRQEAHTMLAEAQHRKEQNKAQNEAENKEQNEAQGAEDTGLEAGDIAPEAQEAGGRFAYMGAGLIAVAAPDWLPGLAGPLASHLGETFARPVMVAIVHPDGSASGSCRSQGGFPLWQALQSPECRELMTRCGGHAFACGLGLPAANLRVLAERLDMLAQAYFAEQARLAVEAGETLGPPVVEFDGEFSCEDATLDALRALARLSPFREDNADPLLLFRNTRVASAQPTRKGEHLRLTLKDARGRHTVTAMAWGRGGEVGAYPAGAALDVAARLVCDTYGGLLTAQLVVEDIRPAV